MSQQFTKTFTQSHYHGYTKANKNYDTCEEKSGEYEHCVRNMATLPAADITKYEIKPYTRSGNCDCGHCSCGTDKIDCPNSGDTTQTEVIHWDDQDCCATCKNQRICSAPNVYDCSSFSANAAVSAVKTYNQPDDSTDRTITCTYDIKTSPDSSGASDFSKTPVVQAYLNKYGADQTFNTVIAPYFCSFPADLTPAWAGMDQEPLDGAKRAQYPVGSKPIASRFVGGGTGGDADICRNWATNGDAASANAATTAMTTWCAQHKWLPECECIEKLDPVYGNDYFGDLYVGMGKEVPGCWWAPCSRPQWDSHNMLVTPSDVDATNCDTACSNIIFVINSSDVNLDDIQQDMACTINEQDIDQKNGGDHPDVDCSTQADPKLCNCQNVAFTADDSAVQQGVKAMNDMYPMNDPANKQLVADKLNAYVAAACYSNPTYTDEQMNAWLSTAPTVTAVPEFDHTTGAFQGVYRQGVPTTENLNSAANSWYRSQQDDNFPCQRSYSVFLDVEQTKTGEIINEHYDSCTAKERTKFSTPDPYTNACPYMFDSVNPITGAVTTVKVNDAYRAACVAARGVEQLPVDGSNPAVDDIDEKYGLCEPTADGECPTQRTYVDDDGVSHVKYMDADEIAACQASPDYVSGGGGGGDGDGGNTPDNNNDDGGDDGSGGMSKMTKVLIAGAAAIGLAAAVALGVTLFRHSSSEDVEDAEEVLDYAVDAVASSGGAE